MTADKTRSRRRGSASLELVLVFPLMVFCAAGVFYAGRAGLARTQAATVARFDAWKDIDKVKDKKALYVLGDVDSQKREVKTSEKFKAWLRGPKNPTAESGTKLFASTWDRHSVKFEPKRGLFVPHFKELLMIGGAGGFGGDLEGVMKVFGDALNWILTNDAILTAGKIANGVLDVGAWWLKYTLLPVLDAARWTVDKLDSIPFVDLSDLVDVFDIFGQSVRNLVEATEEKPGKWFGPKVKKILEDYF